MSDCSSEIARAINKKGAEGRWHQATSNKEGPADLFNKELPARLITMINPWCRYGGSSTPCMHVLDPETKNREETRRLFTRVKGKREKRRGIILLPVPFLGCAAMQ